MKKSIQLKPDMVKEFVSIASKCDFDIDVATNYRYYIDAKSILGVMALDLTKPITISYEGFNADFEAFIRRTAMAC